MTDLVLYFEDEGKGFEDRAVTNGGRFWLASEYMAMLGYDSMASFDKAIQRALRACSSSGIDVFENFKPCQTEVGGVKLPDYKLSRFACFLVAANGDPRKPQVARAQTYLAGLAEATEKYFESVEDVHRVQIRDEITDHEKGLNSAAFKAGVVSYPLFQNAGYRGMYNMNLSDLKALKGVSQSRSLLDFMGKRELAGNQFRVTETEASLKNEGVSGQREAEDVAFSVGARVRKVMIETDGTRPELLPPAGDIKKVRKGLKQTAKELTQLDTSADGS